MPHCENSECARDELPPEEIVENVENGKLICEKCAETVDVVAIPTRHEELVLGRELDYEVSYTKKAGLRAGIRLGGAKLSFEVEQEELNRTFGPGE